MSFAEFMRGKYDPENIPYLSTLVQNMTLKEQASIASDSFETLWKQLWGDDRTSSDYIPSREKFNNLDRVALMRDNLSPYTEPEWGFPKGRRSRGESDLSCAIREFDEETNIPREAFVVLKNIVLEEALRRSNQAVDGLISDLDKLIEQDLLETSMAKVRMRVTQTTWDAFRLTALEGLTGEAVAAQLGMSVDAVYMARCRVQRFISEELKRLEAEG